MATTISGTTGIDKVQDGTITNVKTVATIAKTDVAQTFTAKPTFGAGIDVIGAVAATEFSGNGFDINTGISTNISGNSWIRLYQYTDEHVLHLWTSHNAHPEFYTVVTSLYPNGTQISVSNVGFNYTYSQLNFRRVNSGGYSYIEIQGHQTQGKQLKIFNYNEIKGDIDLSGGVLTWT